MGESFLDACCFIYLIEGASSWRSVVESRLRSSPSPKLATSRLSRLECRARPLRDGNHELLARYDAAFAPESVRIVEISAAIIERATALSAKYRFKAPDAIHLATAIEEGAADFWTGDADLARCADMAVIVLSA